MQHLKIKMKILEKFPSQADFSLAAGEHESKVSQVIRGRKKLSEKEVAKWSKLLNCEPNIFGPVAQGKKTRKNSVNSEIH